MSAVLPGLVASAIGVLALLLVLLGLRLIRQGWIAREHTAELIAQGRWAQAVVVGREPGTNGARVADLRPVVRITMPGGQQLTTVAHQPLHRRRLGQLRHGQIITVAYETEPELSAEIITAGSDSPVHGMMTTGMAYFCGGILLLLFSGLTYLVANLLIDYVL